MNEDVNCKYLVAALREHGGAEFRKAAAAYDKLKIGRVSFIAKSQLGPLDQAQQIRGLTAVVGHDSNVWLVGETTRPDFLVTAVHEAAHLRGMPDNTLELVQTVYDAYMELSPKEREQANDTAQWLYGMTNGQVGHPAKKPEEEK